jgi:hypothetical protein
LADENAKLTDCYYEKKDWRACKQEVSRWSFSVGVVFRASEAEMLPSHHNKIMYRVAFQTTELTSYVDGDFPPMLAEAW